MATNGSPRSSKGCHQCQSAAFWRTATNGGPRNPKGCHQCQPMHYGLQQPMVTHAMRGNATIVNHRHHGAQHTMHHHTGGSDPCFAGGQHIARFTRLKETVCLDPSGKGTVSTMMKQDLDSDGAYRRGDPTDPDDLAKTTSPPPPRPCEGQQRLRR